MKLTVGFNVDPLNNANKFRGVGRYTAKLLEQLYLQKDVKIIEFTGNNHPSKADIIHYPFFDLFFLTLPFIKKAKTIVTIHDCIPLVFPEQYPPGIRGKIKFEIQKYSLRRVDMVLTDSEASKKDIIKYLGVPDKKIKVIYLAGDNKQPSPRQTRLWQTRLEPSLTWLTQSTINNPYFLYVGDVNFNKNLPRLVEAFIVFNEKHNNKYQLAFVGKAFESDSLAETIDLKKLVGNNPQIIFAGYVDDTKLDEYYRNAFCYIQPSLYEGFGLQIVEAMFRGVPVITSNTSSCPEIAGGAGILITPTSVAEIAEAMTLIADNTELRKNMIKNGYNQAKKFSWEKTADEIIKAYRSLAT